MAAGQLLRAVQLLPADGAAVVRDAQLLLRRVGEAPVDLGGRLHVVPGGDAAPIEGQRLGAHVDEEEEVDEREGQAVQRPDVREVEKREQKNQALTQKV